MKRWIVLYKNEDFKNKFAVVYAPTYTLAVLEFMIKYPNCEYIKIKEARRYEGKVQS